MKIAFTADLHFYGFSDFAKQILARWDDDTEEYVVGEGTLINSRLVDQTNAIVNMRNYLIKNNIDSLVIAGDIYNQRGSVETIVTNTVRRIFASFVNAGIDVYAIPGNHDQVSNEKIPENSLTTIEDSSFVFNTPQVIDIHGTNVLMVPYSKDKKYILDSIKSNDADVLVAHLGLTGAISGKTNTVMIDSYNYEDLCPDKFKAIALGHYHKPQYIGNEEKGIYCGANQQHNFNDEGEDRGLWVLDTDTFSWEFVVIDSPKFVTVTDTTTEFNKSDYVKVVMETDSQKQIEAVKESLPDARIEVTKVKTEVRRSAIGSEMNYKQILQTYCKEIGGDKHLDVGIVILDDVLGGMK